ncbi:MAG TPA: carbohydrate binding domain-containing protein [Thermoguttaceae bacterium]|nr:carbohydrate binding domain-containing protein [Thermoguttaceae bacterium]
MICGIRHLLVALVLATAIAGPPAPAAEPVNLLTNGGFEEGTVGWTPDPKHSLVTGADDAHSGQSCLSGEVTGPKQALYLKRRVPVKAQNRYQFEVWAKATNRTKLVLWVVPPGADERQLVTAWDNVPQKWRRLSTPVSVGQDGTLELLLIAPSSHNAPAGRIWVDDLALVETKMPPIASVSQGVGYNDEPAMAAADDGSIYCAWNSFRDGFDSLQVARYRLEGEKLEPAGAWQVCGGEGTYVLGPRVVSAGQSVVVLYAAEVDKKWDICAVTCGADGPGRPLAVTSDAGVDVKPAAAWRDGTLWVAWESNSGGPRQVCAASVRDGKVSTPQVVSRSETSDYAPSVVVLQSGEVCVAWHSFRENNYDVYLRRKPADGDWGPERRLTSAAAVDRHPVLIPRGDDLWLAYENSQTGGRTKPYRIGATDQRRLIVAKVTAEGLLAPKDYAQASPLYAHSEGASGAFDAAGRLWLACLKPRSPAKNWDVFVTCLSGGGWQKPVPVSNQKGLDRPPVLALGGDRALIAFQADPNPGSWKTEEESAAATSDVYLAAMPLDAPPAAGPIELEPLVEPDEPFEAGELRVAYGEDLPTRSIEYQGKKLHLFFGDLHEHTDVSICNRNGDQTIDESYQHMRDIARYDFACATDHGYNLNPYLWNYTAKLARTNDDPDRFVTFLAEEWTSTFEEYSEEHPYGFYGHRNLILADMYFPRWWNARNYQNPAQVWEDLRKMNANFVQIPHQIADTGNVPTDWNYTDEVAQPVAEIFQIRGSYEYQGTPREAARTTPKPGYFLQDAWARGIVIGVVASPDHGGGYGKAAVFAPELTREAILDALRARHCYGTTAAKILLDVRTDGHLMGEKVSKPAPRNVEVTIFARCPGEIARIDVCRNNQFIYTHEPEGCDAQLTFVDREPLAGRSYYYVRVIQEDEEIAWSSPVWFGAE